MLIEKQVRILINLLIGFGAEFGGLFLGWNSSKTQVFAEAVGVGVGAGVKSDSKKIDKEIVYISFWLRINIQGMKQARSGHTRPWYVLNKAF